MSIQIFILASSAHLHVSVHICTSVYIRECSLELLLVLTVNKLNAKKKKLPFRDYQDGVVHFNV